MKNRVRKKGFTLIELMVGVVIALFLTAAAIAFATHETRLMGLSQDRLDMSLGSRSAVNMLADDLRQAGAGVGYAEDGTFGGILLGQFNAGGIAWNPNGVPVAAGTAPPIPQGVSNVVNLVRSNGSLTNGVIYGVFSHEIGIRMATGSYASIGLYRVDGSGVFCNSPGVNFEAGEVVVFRDEDSLSGQTRTINPGAVVPCNAVGCANGCTAFTSAVDPSFSTGAGNAGLIYTGGEIAGGFNTVVWFVDSDANGFGQLRRAEIGNNVCANRANCGAVVANNVETLQAQLWVWDTTANAWAHGGEAPTNATGRMRVDVEMVVRARSASDAPKPPIALRLQANSCIPSPCGTRDNVVRQVFRTSIEIKNSGRMRLR